MERNSICWGATSFWVWGGGGRHSDARTVLRSRDAEGRSAKVWPVPSRATDWKSDPWEHSLDSDLTLTEVSQMLYLCWVREIRMPIHSFIHPSIHTHPSIIHPFFQLKCIWIKVKLFELYSVPSIRLCPWLTGMRQPEIPTHILWLIKKLRGWKYTLMKTQSLWVSLSEILN